MTTTRVRALAAVLRSIDEENRPLVVEDDHSAGIVRAKEISIGQFLPTDVVHIRSYSKTHGPDFRLAALGGPAEIVNAITARGLVGSGWTSHLLQMLLMEMLTDPTAKGQVRRAAVEYRWRRRALTDALAQKGVHVEPGGDGLTVWVPVRDEQAAHNHLLAAGIRTSLGRQFLVSEWLQTSQRRRSGHLRITLGALKDEAIGTVAEILAKAAAIR